MMLRPRHASALMWSLALGACAQPERPADLAIANVTVVDAVQGVLERQTVRIDDGRIISVRPTADTGDGPDDALEVVDGTGRYLMPGLWDFHVHFTYDERFTEAMPGLFLHHGITSVRDTGGRLDAMLPVVEALEQPGVLAPRVFFAGPLLDGAALVYDGVNLPGLGIANPDAETARANVARLAEAGVDFVKIYEMVSPEVFEAIVAEAGARGLPIDGHVPLSMRAREAAPHMQSLEHLRNYEMDCVADPEALRAERVERLAAWDGGPGGELRSELHQLQRLDAIAAEDEAQCAEVVRSLMNTISVPTLRLNARNLRSPFDRSDFDAALQLTPEAVRGDWGAAAVRIRSGAPRGDTIFASWSLRRAGALHDAGAPLAAGTDTPIGWGIPGYSLHTELEMLVEVGLSAREALYAATLRPAEFFGLANELGTVQPGRLADLVLLGGNPLEDIANTRRIEAVVTRGRLLDRTELDQLVDPDTPMPTP